ncbi:MAG: LamG domain-containing protein [Planctomycetes bacterium]|nr:LamG domain-containing protein [Planctomycetota bacterium]
MFKKLIYLVLFVFVLSVALTGTAKAEMVGWWKLDEGSGTAANDSSGFGHHGTITEPIWEAGQFGSALKFEGSSYVDIPAEAWSSIETQATITFWAYGDPEAQPQANFIFGAFQDPPNNESRVMSAHVPWSNGNVYFDTGGTTAGGYDRISQAATPEEFAGSWQHWAMVKNADTGDQMVYLNGVLWLSGTGMTRPMTGVTKFTIGTKPSLAEGWYYGMMDDVRLYDHPLSEDEILAVMEGAGAGYPYALGPSPADGSMHFDTWANLSWRAGDFAVSHDVYMGENFDDVDAGAESTFQGNQSAIFFVAGFPGFAFPDGLVPGTTYYWRIDEVNDTEPNSPWKGDIWSFMIPPKTAYFPDPADSGEAVAVNGSLSWTPGFGAKLHTVYFGDNFDDVSNAAGGLPQGGTTYTPGELDQAKTYYWRVDEFDAIETYTGDVWSFTTEGAVAALNPSNGAVDVTQTPVLTWAPGLGASHEVYFGADAASLELKGSGNLGSESYEPGQIEWNTTYYWRVDEANATNADSPWTGPLWSFTTANFLIIDDFESYNDNDPADPESNRIFNAWLDGFDNPAINGSVVGNANPPFAEQSIVNGGLQSMPLAYDNAVGKSEATLTLTANRDWTVNGVTTLTIWFRGNSANAAEPLYAALNGGTAVTNDNPDAAQSTTWTEWNIDLQAFGANLSNVNTLTIGLGNSANPVAGGAGMMYFDDIRLYPPAQ